MLQKQLSLQWIFPALMAAAVTLAVQIQISVADLEHQLDEVKSRLEQPQFHPKA